MRTQSPSTTLTVRLPAELKRKLGELCEHTNRSKSFLAAAAIADYVARELAIVKGIEQGLEDMRENRVMSHDTVMSEIDAIITAAATARETA